MEIGAFAGGAPSPSLIPISPAAIPANRDPTANESRSRSNRSAAPDVGVRGKVAIRMENLTPKDHAEAVALFRSEIVGALTRIDLPRGALAERLEALSQQRFRPPGATATRTFAVPTLERWYRHYKKGGLAALRPEPRSDRGAARALTAEQQELLCDVRRERPSASAELILDTLVADGRLELDVISPSSLRRLFAARGLDKRTLRNAADGKQRLRWEASHPGALWHGDVCHGAHLLIGGEKKPVRIHGMLDDASRYVVALEAMHQEREVDMLGLFVRAIRKHGPPDAIYLDNGATYRGHTLALACARMGTTLLHAKPYDAPAHGKMERFWRTLRERCLDFAGTCAATALPAGWCSAEHTKSCSSSSRDGSPRRAPEIRSLIRRAVRYNLATILAILGALIGAHCLASRKGVVGLERAIVAWPFRPTSCVSSPVG